MPKNVIYSSSLISLPTAGGRSTQPWNPTRYDFREKSPARRGFSKLGSRGCDGVRESPNFVNGTGVEWLKEKGIRVEVVPGMEEECLKSSRHLVGTIKGVK